MTPPDCDLRGLPFMPLDVVRLGDSDLFALSTGEEFKAAVSLWCKAWLQVPAASLPDDPRILAHLSGTGSRWSKVAAMALRGWVKCSDGRLYHPVVAEKACEAWKHRQTQRARANKRWGNDPGNATTAQTVKPQQCPGDAAAYATEDAAAMQGTGTVKGQGEKIDSSLRSESIPRASRAANLHPDFADFWAAYPRKVGKGAAEKAFASAIAKGASVADIATGLNRQTWPADRRFIAHPSRWLNERRWQDDPAAASPKPPEPAGKMDWIFRDMAAEKGEEYPDFNAPPPRLIQ
jgi:hypothetical protein